MAAFDLPGHGASSAPADFAIPALGGSILSVMDAIGWPRVVGIGFSLGATALLHATTRAPERFVAAMHVGLPPDDPAPALRARFHALAGAITDGFPPELAAELSRLWYSTRYRAEHPDLIERIRGLLAGNRPAIAAAFLHASAELPPLLPLPAGYAVPTLVVAMEDDPVTPLASAASLVAALRAEVVRLPGGHLPFDECPAALARAIDRFLDDHG